MQAPGHPPGMPALLGRLTPGDHGLLFGPAQFSPALLKGLLDRAALLRFRLVVAQAGMSEVEVARLVARVPGGPAAAARGAVTSLDAEALGVFQRALAQEGQRAFRGLRSGALRHGFEGVLLSVLHTDAGPETERAEAAISARLPPDIIVQCLYPHPPAARDVALRVLRAHTPGSMVMPGLWRLAEQATPDSREPVLA